MIGTREEATADGEVYRAGEHIRALADLEAEERERLARFCAKAIAAGLAERQVRVAERRGADMVLEALATAGVPEEYAAAFRVALAQQVRAIGVTTT